MIYAEMSDKISVSWKKEKEEDPSLRRTTREAEKIKMRKKRIVVML
jgi:hypothetical protein